MFSFLRRRRLKSHRKEAGRTRHRLAFESLEPRRVMALLVPLETNASGTLAASEQDAIVRLNSAEMQAEPLTVSRTPWHNADKPADVSGDGFISNIDLLFMQEALNAYGAGHLPSFTNPPVKFVDVNGDENLSSIDLISLIDALNSSRTSLSTVSSWPASFSSSESLLPGSSSLSSDTASVAEPNAATIAIAVALPTSPAAFASVPATHLQSVHRQEGPAAAAAAERQVIDSIMGDLDARAWDLGPPSHIEQSLAQAEIASDALLLRHEDLGPTHY